MRKNLLFIILIVIAVIGAVIVLVVKGRLQPPPKKLSSSPQQTASAYEPKTVTAAAKPGAEPAKILKKEEVVDYKTYNELKFVRQIIAMLEVSKETSDEIMKALEDIISGDVDNGLARLEALFARAGKDERPQLGMLLLNEYLNYGKMKRAENILKTLQAEFPESTVAYLAQAYLDLKNERPSLAFPSIEKVFVLGKKDKSLFFWFSVLGGFHGSSEQERKIEEWFSEYRKLNPGNVPILFSTMAYYENQQRPADALAVFAEMEKICEDKELLAHALNGIAWQYASNGKIEEGAQALRRAIELDPQNPWALVSLAHYFSSVNKGGESIEYLNEALKLTENRVMRANIQALIAQTYQRLGEREKMAEAYRQTLQLDSTNPGVLLQVAQGYRSLGQMDRAIELCQEALSQGEKSGLDTWTRTAIYQQLAALYESKRDPDKTLEYLEKDYQAKPGANADAIWQYFKKYSQYKSPDALIKKAGEMLKQDPNNPAIYRNLANLYVSWGKYDEAIANYQKAIESSEQDRDKIRFAQGIVSAYLEKKDNVKARETAEKMTTDFPYDWQSYFNLASVYEKTNERQKAIAEYETAGELAGPVWDKIRPLQQIARLYDEMGETGKAIETYRNAVEMLPVSWTNSLLAEYYRKKEKYPEAITAYQQARDLSWDVGEKGNYCANIAEIQLKQGKERDAVETMKEYVGYLPRDPQAHARLAAIYRQTKDYRDAEAEYRRAVELVGEDKQAKIKHLDGLAEMLTVDTQEFNKAVEAAGAMIALDPDYGKGYERLAAVYEKQNLFQQAADTYAGIAERAVGPDNWRYVEYTGKAAVDYARAGKTDYALGMVNEARQKSPGNYLAQQNVGDVYHAANRLPQALLEYEKALAMAPEGKRTDLEKKIAEIKDKIVGKKE